MEGQVQPQTYYCSLSRDSSNEKQLLTFLLMNEMLFFHGRCSKILKMLRSPDESLSHLGKRTRKDKVKSLMNAKDFKLKVELVKALFRSGSLFFTHI